MDFGLKEFKQMRLGLGVGEIFKSPTTLPDMFALSRHNIPAVQVLGKPILALGLPVTDADKKNIGRWVREVMEENGWTTDASSKGRVAPGNLFSTGAIYRPKK